MNRFQIGHAIPSQIDRDLMNLVQGGAAWGWGVLRRLRLRTAVNDGELLLRSNLILFVEVFLRRSRLLHQT